jgi:50S ribosomal subunit-associated GTPase HflX
VDVNGDGRVDVADAVVTVGYIIGDHTLSARQFNAADVDKNVAVDVVDLVAIINIILVRRLRTRRNGRQSGRRPGC